LDKTTVCCIIEDCDNITNYCCLVECDIPEFTPELESITVNTGSMNLCLNDSKSITPLVSVIAHYTEGPSKTVTSLATITYSSNNDSIASINGTTVTGNALGSTSINVSATYIEGGITVDSTGTVPVNVIDCSTCIPELNSLTVVLGNTTPMTLCNGATTTINSSHIASIIAHYTCEAPDVTLLLSDCSYVSENSGIASVSGLNVTGNSVGTTNIVVSYTDGGKKVTATQKVPVNVTDCTTLTSITVAPSPMNLCKKGTGTLGTETGTIVTTAHYSDGSSMVVTADSYSGYNTSIVASVDSTGLVTSGSTTGSTTVTVSYKGKTATMTVNVTDCTIYYDLTMKVSPAGSGTTIPSVGGSPYTYSSGTVVPISATPAAGYHFVNWTGDVANSNSASTTVTMNANKTVTANFKSIITIDGLHANLASGDGTDVWDLHVWAWINNNSSQIFPGKMRIRSYQESGKYIEKWYPSKTGYAAINITPGKNRYPSGNDYWLMDLVAEGHGKPQDVFVEIRIYDTLGNEVAYASKYAN